MSFYFSVCSTYNYHSKYIDFLLEHYTDLQLPYPFAATLGYIASPLLMGNEAVLAFNDEDQVVGAFGYIHGTGEKDYRDVQIIQIQSVYITKAYRGTGLFVQGLQFLLEHVSMQPTAVEELRFWAPNQPDSHKLFSKFATLVAGRHSESVPVSEYRLSPEELRTYLAKFKQRIFS